MTCIKPDFDGAETTWQKPVWVRSGDLVLSNIKAWEGAIAVAQEAHEGSIASDRYITCVPDEARATAGFLAYYLLTPDGLEKIGLASPGTADRNCTLSLGNLGRIEVPLPPLATQKTFNCMQAEVAARVISRWQVFINKINNLENDKLCLLYEIVKLQ